MDPLVDLGEIPRYRCLAQVSAVSFARRDQIILFANARFCFRFWRRREAKTHSVRSVGIFQSVEGRPSDRLDGDSRWGVLRGVIIDDDEGWGSQSGAGEQAGLRSFRRNAPFLRDRSQHI